ncbi:phosphotransferase [Rhodococcus qingshengii]|uniref:phosphotransferase n=1 Tax=Rhodococcus qingshengii TaxID=334542 RepID=UPI003650F632
MIAVDKLAVTLEQACHDAGIASVDLDSLRRSRYGRNDNLHGVLIDGTGIFIKIFDDTPEARRRQARSTAADRAVPNESNVSPRLLAWADAPPLLMFEDVEGSDLMTVPDADGWSAADAAVVADCAAVLARLHAVPIDDTEYEEHSLPPVRALGAIPAEVYVAVSAAELHAWRILQTDTELAAELRRIAARDRAQTRSFIHGDVRLDQFLQRSSGEVVLLDWEEFRVGDPARDVGALVGDVLHRSLLRIVRPTSRFHEEFAHAEVLRRGGEVLEDARPVLVELWEKYQNGNPVDADFTARATKFAGWHLFDRLLASAHRSVRLPPIALACAGIGRNALLRTDAFSSVIHPQRVPIVAIATPKVEAQ